MSSINIKNKNLSVFKIFSYIFFFSAICVILFAIINLISSTFKTTENFFENGTIESAGVQATMYVSFIGSLGQAVVQIFWGFMFNFFDKIYQKNKRERIIKDIDEQLKREKKRNDKQKSSPIFYDVDEDIDSHQHVAKKKRIFCEYCGNELIEDERKCPYCGASKKVIKEFDN